jgi:O-antigen/teichoic acid export membrane protein
LLSEKGGAIAGGRQRLVRNALHNSGAWVVTALVAMLSTPYLVYALGAEGYGVYVLLTSLVGYYGLFDLALGQGVVKFVAQYAAEGNDEGITQSINAALSLQLLAGAVGSCLLALGADFVLHVLRVSDVLLDSARISLFLCCGGFFFTMINGTLNSVLMGLQRYDVSSKIKAITNSAVVIVTVGVVAGGGGLTAAVLVTVAGSLVSCLVSYRIVRMFVRTWRFSPALRGHFVKSVYRFSSFLFLSRISDLANNYLGRFLIGGLLGPAAVTVYTVPTKLLNAIWGVLGSGFGVLMPFASEMTHTHDDQAKRSLFLKASRLFAVATLPLFALLFAFSYPILRLWMGEAFAREAWPVLSILSVASVVASVTSIPIQLILGWGHSRLVGLFSLGTIIAYIGALVVLSPAWGVVGAAASMVIAGLPGLCMVFVVLRRVVHVRWLEYVRSVYLYHVIGLAAAVALWMLRDYIAGLSLGAAALTAATFALLYFALLGRVGWFPVGAIFQQVRGDASRGIEERPRFGE